MNDDYLLVNNSGARCKAYNMNIANINNKINFSTLDKGYRVDSIGGNFILIRNELYLGFSYLTLVIQEKLKIEDLNNKNFDFEGFCYILNGESEFHHLYENYAKLKYVLERYMNYETKMID